MCLPPVAGGVAAPRAAQPCPGPVAPRVRQRRHTSWTPLNLQIQGCMHGARSDYRDCADQPSGKSSFARFSSYKTDLSAPPARQCLGRNGSGRSSMRLQDKRRFLRSRWYNKRSVSALVWFQCSSRHGIRGADVFSCSRGKLIAVLASILCPSEPVSCRISSDIIITCECCRCSST